MSIRHETPIPMRDKFRTPGQIREKKANEEGRGSVCQRRVINHRDYLKWNRPTTSDILWTVIINHAVWSKGTICMLNLGCRVVHSFGMQFCRSDSSLKISSLMNIYFNLKYSFGECPIFILKCHAWKYSFVCNLKLNYKLILFYKLLLFTKVVAEIFTQQKILNNITIFSTLLKMAWGWPNGLWETEEFGIFVYWSRFFRARCHIDTKHV